MEYLIFTSEEFTSCKTNSLLDLLTDWTNLRSVNKEANTAPDFHSREHCSLYDFKTQFYLLDDCWNHSCLAGCLIRRLIWMWQTHNTGFIVSAKPAVALVQSVQLFLILLLIQTFKCHPFQKWIFATYRVIHPYFYHYHILWQTYRILWMLV